MSTALIYSRVSTEEQAEEGQSIETQIRICKKWAKDNNYQIEGIYSDEGKSATNLNRPALQDLLAKCKDGIGISAILVQDTDRLARNTLDHLTIKAILKKKNIKIISISQPMIDDSPEGNLIDTILASVNTFQSQITGRKTSKVLEEKAKMGWYPGGLPPLGYKNVENSNPTSTLDKRIVVVDPEIGSYMKQMFEKYLTNTYSVQQLADWLNEKGIKSVTGGSISHSTVHNYLNSTFYMGTFLWNGKEYNGKHERLIDKETYNRVQELLCERNQNASRKRVHNFLLSGFAYCADCGSRFWAERHIKKTGKVYDHYFCSKCKTNTYVEVDVLEREVELLFKKIQLTKEYTNYILEIAKSLMLNLRQTNKTEKDILLKKKSKLEIALRELEDARFVHKTITEDNFLRIFNRYNKDIENIDNNIAGLQVDHGEKIKTLEVILKLTENIGNAYSSTTPQLKRSYLNLFFKKIEVKKGKISKYYLTDGLKELITNGSVRVRTTGLEKWSQFRTTDWVNYLEYPEFTGKEINRILANFF